MRDRDKVKDTELWICCDECKESILVRGRQLLLAHDLAVWAKFKPPTQERRFTELLSREGSL